MRCNVAARIAEWVCQCNRMLTAGSRITYNDHVVGKRYEVQVGREPQRDDDQVRLPLLFDPRAFFWLTSRVGQMISRPLQMRSGLFRMRSGRLTEINTAPQVPLIGCVGDGLLILTIYFRQGVRPGTTGKPPTVLLRMNSLFGRRVAIRRR